jgi:hypothetical protein
MAAIAKILVKISRYELTIRCAPTGLCVMWISKVKRAVLAGGFGLLVLVGTSACFPVYTKAQIDSWSATSPEYTRLANSGLGNVNHAWPVYGAEISTTERDVFRDEASYLKVQAVLWAADDNPARKAKVVALLNDLRAVTSFQWDPVEQYRLVAGWAVTNLAQAAAIVNYRDPEFTRFLVQVCYPILDWPNGPNWHGSFADSKLAIAAYTNDQALWTDAKAYFYQRIAQSIYHSRYDGGKVRPLVGADGAPQIQRTVGHWGATGAGSQIKSDLTPINPAQFPDGTNAERLRDLSHVQLGLAAFMHGARTIRASGHQLEAHAYDRLLAGYAHQAQRVLGHLNTGVIPEPVPINGAAGTGFLRAWYGACTLFGTDTPADVAMLCRDSRVASQSAAGVLHVVAEAFADRS